MTAFPNLQGHKFMSLTTFRKTGVPVATPVWFAQEGDVLYMFSELKAGKVKRLRSNANVTVAPCDFRGQVLGDSLPAVARLLSGDEATHASAVMNRKYGLQKRVIDWLDMIRRRQDQTQYIELRPA